MASGARGAAAAATAAECAAMLGDELAAARDFVHPERELHVLVIDLDVLPFLRGIYGDGGVCGLNVVESRECSALPAASRFAADIHHSGQHFIATLG